LEGVKEIAVTPGTRGDRRQARGGRNGVFGGCYRYVAKGDAESEQMAECVLRLTDRGRNRASRRGGPCNGWSLRGC